LGGLAAVNLTGKGPLGLKAPKPERGTAKARAYMARVKSKKNETALRKSAKGKPCTLRLPGCRMDNDYTVLAHIRRFGWGGTGIKPHDILAIFACDKCHEKQERHDDLCDYKEVLRALGETLMIQLQSGMIKVSENDGMD
jgi:hypothetical protein